MNISSSLSTSLAAPLPTGPLPADSAKGVAAAKDFEAVFISEMMSHMFEGVKTDPEFGGGQGEDMFHGLLVQEYGKQMAKAGGIGISDQLQKAMIQLQQHKG